MGLSPFPNPIAMFKWYMIIPAIAMALLLIFKCSADAADKKIHPAAASQAPTQSECMAAYMASCSSVPFAETAIRACIVAHKPECLELIRGIK